MWKRGGGFWRRVACGGVPLAGCANFGAIPREFGASNGGRRACAVAPPCERSEPLSFGGILFRAPRGWLRAKRADSFPFCLMACERSERIALEKRLPASAGYSCRRQGVGGRHKIDKVVPYPRWGRVGFAALCCGDPHPKKIQFFRIGYCRPGRGGGRFGVVRWVVVGLP